MFCYDDKLIDYEGIPELPFDPPLLKYTVVLIYMYTIMYRAFICTETCALFYSIAVFKYETTELTSIPNMFCICL